MSMFHELMMRKKEETLYPVIKGSLTESPEGVFSGFSSSDYLEVQDGLDLTKSWEFQITFTTGNDISTEQFILTDTQTPSPIGFGIFTNSQFVVYYMNTQGARVYTFINGLSANTKYKVNLKYNRDEHKFYVYIDGVQKVAISSIYSFSNRKIRFGVSRTFTSAFAGSIDLNNSYIKLGSTKYKLQAVVGYTIVGSPTIDENGVASGFSSANYLRTSKLPILSEDFEMQFKIRINDTSINNALLGWVSSGYANYFRFSTSGKIQISFRVSSSVYYNINGNFVFSTNTDYWVKYSKKGKTFYLYYSTDGVNWFLDNSATFEEIISFSVSNYFRIGVDGFNNPSSYFNGSIDLNETYIKINNKLWFNGQEG